MSTFCIAVFIPNLCNTFDVTLVIHSIFNGKNTKRKQKWISYIH